MNRYHLRNNTHMIEFPATESGLVQAKHYRRCNAAFKGRHIRHVLQLLPNKVPLGKIMELVYGYPRY